MFWTGLAVGMLVGAAFGVIIMSLIVAGKQADERDYIDKQCRQCDIYLDETSDTSVCFSCTKAARK